VPRVVISIPNAILGSSKNSSTSLLKGFLDKFNGSQVDQLFKEIGIPEVAGSSPETIEEFANEVNKSTKLWPAEIARQTRLVDSAFPNSVEREIDFWKDLDKKLADTKEQLESPGVCLTKLVLKRNNRVSEQLIREAESELDRCIEIVQVSVTFLRDFPIDELQSAVDLLKLSRATTLCLQHFAKLKHSRYDFSRAVRLMEVVGAALFSRLAALLREKDIMGCSIEELRKVHTQAETVFLTWDAQYATQRGTLKDVAKRRKETMRSLQFDNAALQQRLGVVVEFREQHERLLNVFSVVMSGQESEATMGVNEAYQLVIRSVSDVMDISEAGTRAWISAHQMYEKRLERTEEKVTRLLEDRLGAAQTAEEMFRVFSTFNPLFFRPAIRNAVNSFRAALVKNVREDVRRLQDKFRLRYEDSLERATADLRDIPPLSGTIIWARQIENQLTTLMKRLEDVLGLGWEEHFEGKQLKEVCDELHTYLDTDQLYKDWLQVQLKADTQKYSKLKEFLLLVVDDPRSGRKTLQVNFDDKQVVVFKEVRYLEWLLPGMSTTHKAIPSTLLSMSREAYARYPIATALQAALSGFAQAKSGISTSNSVLLTSHVQAVRDIIKEAIGGSKRTKRWIKWDSASDLNDWVGQFSNKVYALQEKVDDVTEKISKIEEYLQQLRSCPYVRVRMGEILGALQATVDEVQIRGFSNVAAWVSDLDARIETILLDRLKTAVKLWVQAFSSDSLTVDATDNQVDESPLKSRQKGFSSVQKRKKLSAAGLGWIEKDKEIDSAEDKLTLDPTLHEVLLSNQILFVAPPLEQARIDWIAAFHQHVSIVCTLPRISSSRFNVFAGATVGPSDYSSTLLLIDQSALAEPFIVMEQKLAQAKEYTEQWLQYQALWDASSSELAEKVGRDIRKWQQLLSEIKSARTTIDSNTEELSFGPIIVNHRQVQNKVNLKYDTWQKESQLRFGTILIEEIKTAHADIVSSKTKLESIALQGPTKDVIIGVEYILKTKSSLSARKQLVVDLESSEKLLQKQRYQFPTDWLSVSNVVGSLADLCQILDRRIASMDAQLPSLQLKIREEDSLNAGRTEDLLNSWEIDRPVQGGLVPNVVLQTLSMFATQIVKLTEDAARVNGAKDALGLDFITDDRLSFVAREVADLKEVWHYAAPLYERLNAMRATLLRGDFNPIKIRKQLEDLSDELKNLPAKARSYAAIEWAQETLSKRQSIQPILRDLSTEALKDRHWKILLHAMGLAATHTSHDLTLGALWECNPLAHRKVIQEVLSTAQGELALEQFLRDLREHWVSCELSLALRDGVRLIVGWDVLFSTLEDNLNSLASLKQSPYFRNVPEFQEDTANWETRLTNLRAIFDIWVEVQRKWVYLRGIFRNPDIKAQLPAQFSKFKSVDNEFLSLMKRVALKPCVVDLLQVDNLARQLERQDTTMTIIQKALGEYLERQRQIFPVSLDA
jgi:dynein heavy chain 1, cytosolic